MDTDCASGRDSSIADVKLHHKWSPVNSLLLYPTIEDFEKNNPDKKNIDLSLSCCWMTGFTPMRRGMPDSANMSQNSRNFIDGMSVNTTDQILKARSDGTLAALFSRMAWYGGKDARIVDLSLVTDNEAVNKITDRGFVSKSWATSPVQVRYMVHMLPESEATYDYIYFIGGSEDIIGDNLKAIPQTITQLYDQIKALKDESKKSTKSKKGEADDEFSGADPKYLWYAYTKQANDPVIKANLLAKRILRIVEGIIFIRNYLAYAKNRIGISELEEVIGYDTTKKAPVLKTVEIEKILEKYDTIYAYCKNLCYIYKDIGAGDIM